MIINLYHLLEYSKLTWTEGTDVLAVPSPTWGYGLRGKDPLQGVAETGTANFSLDNRDGKYSPENANRTDGFEEGMPVKITSTIPEDVVTDSNALLNGTLEAWD